MDLDGVILVLDDSTLDKPYAKKMELVTRHWSGKHNAVVRGINLLTLLWTEGDRHVPCDYRVFEKAKDGLTKNDHVQHLLVVAQARGFHPACVVFDSWYAGLENLKLLRSFQWIWLTRLKSNRRVNPDRQGLRSIRVVELGEHGRVVWLEGYGLVRAFKIVTVCGDNLEHANQALPFQPYHSSLLARGWIAPRGSARAQVPRSVARRVPVSGWTAQSPAAGGR